jgi:hypothetical protein
MDARQTVRDHDSSSEGSHANQKFQGYMYTELQELVSMESQIDIALKRMADALR